MPDEQPSEAMVLALAKIAAMIGARQAAPGLDRDAVEEIADRSAKKAVEEFGRLYGFDPDEAKKIKAGIARAVHLDGALSEGGKTLRNGIITAIAGGLGALALRYFGGGH